jgi:hypothetical protein
MNCRDSLFQPHAHRVTATIHVKADALTIEAKRNFTPAAWRSAEIGQGADESVWGQGKGIGVLPFVCVCLSTCQRRVCLSICQRRLRVRAFVLLAAGFAMLRELPAWSDAIGPGIII